MTHNYTTIPGQIKTVLFDLDGTLINTNELIIQTFLHVLVGKTPQPITREMIIPHMGKPLAEQLQTLSGIENVEPLIMAYRAYNIENHDRLATRFPDVLEVVSALHQSGIVMGVVTSKARITTQMGLELCGLEKFMSVIVTIDEIKNPKPHPESVLLAIETLSVQQESTLMVGDSSYDIQAAQRAGVKSAGVAWSLKGVDYLCSFDPDYMLMDIKDLLQIISAP